MPDQETPDPAASLIETAVGPIAITRHPCAGARAIICVHGAPGAARQFRYLAPELRTAFDVICVDMPGFGESPMSHIRSARGWTEVIAAVADALELERPALLGHSFGAATALQAASRWPERFCGLILLAPPGVRRHRAYLVPPWLMRALAFPTTLPLLSAPFCAYARRMYRRLKWRVPDDDALLSNLVTVVGTASFRRNERLARSLELPTQLFHCEDDLAIQVSIARELADLFPDCQAHYYEDGGHNLQKTRARDIAAAVADKFGGAGP